MVVREDRMFMILIVLHTLIMLLHQKMLLLHQNLKVKILNQNWLLSLLAPN